MSCRMRSRQPREPAQTWVTIDLTDHGGAREGCKRTQAGARLFNPVGRLISLWDYRPRLIVPVIEPDEISVGMLSVRAMTILPEASANRPVPPVMVWVSVIVAMGNVITPSPADVVKIWSLL